MTGGNIGWQAGVQATDVILVFRSRRSVEGILAGKFTLGADAAAAAGPIGRQASAATDQHLTAEILSYSRSRGLFAGVSLDGSVMQIDRLATTAYYPSVASGSAGVAVDAAQQVFIPEAAQQLTAMVAGYAGSNTAQVGPGPAQPAMAQQFAAQNAAALRGQLAQTSVSLYELLDDSWRAYLAMPAGVFAANEQPSIQSLQASLDRFESVAVDPRYQALASRAEFQSTHALLKNYLQAFTQTAAPLQLPPPPSLAPQ